MNSKRKNDCCKPPRLSFWVLKKFLQQSTGSPVLGDLTEEFELLCVELGNRKAKRWLSRQIFRSFYPFVRHKIYWSIAMWTNHLKIAIRMIKKNWGYTSINVAGLAIGMATCILILMMVSSELNYDDFHEKGNRIHRITIETTHSGKPFFMAPTMLPLAPALNEQYPEVEHAVRISSKHGLLFRTEDQAHYEAAYYVDQEIFDVFTLPLAKGNPEIALAQPNSIVLTHAMAEKYFGVENPLNKLITINDVDYRVTGVLKPVTGNNHFRIRPMASFSSLANTERVRANNWTRFSNDYTYILLEEGSEPSALESKFPDLLGQHIELEEHFYALHLQPLKDIHFSNLNYDFARTSEPTYMTAFSAIALFILLIACLNFINLTTAKSTQRAREVGLRKVVGAQRWQLVRQFLAESVLMSLLATGIAVILVTLTYSELGSMTGRLLSFHPWQNGEWILLSAVAVVIGILAGSYPAWVMSAHKPVKTLHKVGKTQSKRLSLRTLFVTFQFTISIILIIVTLVVRNQIGFMQSKDLGINENIVIVPLHNSPVRNSLDSFQAGILTHPAILSTTSSNGTPASGQTRSSSYQVGAQEGDYYLNEIWTDFGFIETFGLDVIDGRAFSKVFSTDATDAVILNRKAVQLMGLEAPVGQRINNSSREGIVIGVVDDFHYSNLRVEIEPMVIMIDSGEQNFLSVRINPDQRDEAMTFLESRWKEASPHHPFEPFLVGEEFDSWYRFEKKLVSLFSISAGLAVFVSCLGILGLASFSARQRTKEIGIRKVLGASVSDVIGLLALEFVRWVLIANVVAWPVSYYLMNNWLQEYAYKTSIHFTVFLLSGVMAFFIATFSVGYQALKAATTNPVNVLRQE